MAKIINDIGDDEIRIIGAGPTPQPKRPKLIIIIVTCIVILLVIGGAIFLSQSKKESTPTTGDTEESNIENSYFEEQPVASPTDLSTRPATQTKLSKLADSIPAEGYTEILEHTINDIPLRIYIPHNATPSLHVGEIPNNPDIILVAQAADIRRDNGKIVGAFVLKGKPLAWGLSKTGYCAIINDTLTVGTAQNSPLFEKATEQEGYFFRQYSLVHEGKLIENEPKNKSIRRALCDRNGEIFIAESLSKESFHDFSQALVDLGVNQAIYLVGSSSYGFSVDNKGARTEFGSQAYRQPKRTNYILWQKN